MNGSRMRGWMALAVLALAGTLSACAGISGLEQARAMTPEQLAQQSDEYVCERLRGFGYIADVPVTWLREAQRRDLESCIEQGVAQRRNADRLDNRFMYCDRFATGPWVHCW